MNTKKSSSVDFTEAPEADLPEHKLKKCQSYSCVRSLTAAQISLPSLNKLCKHSCKKESQSKRLECPSHRHSTDFVSETPGHTLPVRKERLSREGKLI